MDIGQPLRPIRRRENIKSELLRAMFDYWQSKAAGRRMPDRADIDPAEIPRLLPNITLVEILPDRVDCFRYRLVGTEIVRAFGREMTGRTTDDIPDRKMKALAVETFSACRDAGAPMVQEWLRPWKGVRDYERILLPLARGADRVAIVMLGIDVLADANADKPFAVT
jgi:hypothetical protein